MQLADLVVVTKADVQLASSANHAAADLRRALHLLHPRYEGLSVDVILVSSPNNIGISEVWEHVRSIQQHLKDSGQLDTLRAHQATAWMWDELRSGLMDRFRSDPHTKALLAELEPKVLQGELTPTSAALRLLGEPEDH